MANKVIANQLPTGIQSFDLGSGVAHSIGDCQYTAITTTGTTTVKPTAGVFYGLTQIALGTAASVSVFDGATALLGTNTIALLNGVLTPAPSGLGIRFNTSLVVVTAGTGAASVNVLWD
jgi:hypothetical protein